MIILRILGNAFVAFLDFSVGAFLVFLGSHFLNYNAQVYEYFLGGIIGLLPDIDLLLCVLLKNNRAIDHHQFISHRPLIVIPLASMAGFLFGNSFWAIIAPLCVFWHYIHDTEGFVGGGGMAWLWPFSKKYLSPLTGTDEAKQYQNFNKLNDWISATWLVPSPNSITELTVGSILFYISAGVALNWWISAVLIVLLWLCVVGVWITFPFIKNRSNLNTPQKR